MKSVIQQVGRTVAFDLEVIDIDANLDLQARYDAEVPVLFVDGRKAFKYRVTSKQLEKRMARRPASMFKVISAVLGRRKSS
jgi:hypothetical protein